MGDRLRREGLPEETWRIDVKQTGNGDFSFENKVKCTGCGNWFPSAALENGFCITCMEHVENHSEILTKTDDEKTGEGV